MKKLKKLIIAAAAALLVTAPAFAQVAQVQKLGLVTQDIEITLESNAGKLSRFKAGQKCIMREGTIVALLGPTADGKERIQRTNLIAIRFPNRQTCPEGASGPVEATVALAMAKAHQDKVSAKGGATKKN